MGFERSEDVQVLIQFKRSVGLEGLREHHADDGGGEQREREQRPVQRPARG